MTLRDRTIWWSGLVAIPVLLGQAIQTRRKTPLLPSAPSPHSGTCVAETASLPQYFSIYLVGESTVAGVGARDHEHGLAGQLARELSKRLFRPVRWEALGLVGARARECLEGQIDLELPPRLNKSPADVVIIVLGVNDTTKLTPRARWRQTLLEIVTRCRRETPCPIVFTGIPPMEHFTALPWPLRTVLGARARLLDHDLQHVAEGAPNCLYHSIGLKLEGGDLAADGFHPSEQGYSRWARELADHLARELRAAIPAASARTPPVRERLRSTREDV